jgi:hypothetical protein
MKKSIVKQIIKAAESLDWSVTESKDGDIEFGKFSPAGQDFSINISANSLEDLADQIYDRYENFDCSEEAYIWLDNTGHGKNGAPYDMKDLYEDMEACQEMLGDLATKIQNIK